MCWLAPRPLPAPGPCTCYGFIIDRNQIKIFSVLWQTAEPRLWMLLYFLSFHFLCLLCFFVCNFNLIKVMNKQGCCFKGTCEKTTVREHPVVMSFGLLTQKYHPPFTTDTLAEGHNMLTYTQIKHIQSHLHWECMFDVASLTLRLLSSPSQFF